MPENFRQPGALRYRFDCQKRGDGNDGWGTSVEGQGDFESQFGVHAAMRPRTGGEGVDAARLGGTQPYVVTVRKTSNTKLITVAWQLVDARDNSRVFAVTSPPADPDGRGAWLEFIVTEGVQA